LEIEIEFLEKKTRIEDRKIGFEMEKIIHIPSNERKTPIPPC
jgi:hypothetical protein